MRAFCKCFVDFVLKGAHKCINKVVLKSKVSVIFILEFQLFLNSYILFFGAWQ